MTNTKELTIGEIKAACRQLLDALGPAATNELMFTLLVDVAYEEYGLELEARQLGIRGTRLRFTKAR